MSKRCSAKNKNGKRCGAWSTIGKNKCPLHLDPTRAAEMGAKHGRKARLQSLPETGTATPKPLKNLVDLAELLEETINRVRQGPFELRAANTTGFLTSILFKIQEADASSAAKTGKGAPSQIYAKRLYLPIWRRETIEKLQAAGIGPTDPPPRRQR